MNPIFFAKQVDFRKQPEKNHEKQAEPIIGLCKTGSKKSGVNWSQLASKALCFDRIDGARRNQLEKTLIIESRFS